MARIAPAAVDAMGGDHAPAAVVQGAVAAARRGQPVALVGPEPRLREELARCRAGAGLPIEVRHAPVVRMEEQEHAKGTDLTRAAAAARAASLLHGGPGPARALHARRGGGHGG